MAVEIPRIQRFEAQAPQSAGRLEMQAPNLLGATAPMREGLNSLVSEGAEYVTEVQQNIRKQEIATKDLKAVEYGVKYETALKNKLTEIELMKGDTTESYKEFDQTISKLESSLYDEVTDPETQMLLRDKINKANGRINETRTLQQTKQYYSWQKDVADSSVKLRQDNAMKASQFLDVKNDATFNKVNRSIYEIESTRAAIGRQNGFNIEIKDTVGVVNPDTGEIEYQNIYDFSNAPQVEAQIKADIGDAVIPMVKSLNAAGKVNEAKALIDSQKRWLNAKDIASLTADNNEANVKSQALAYVSTMKNRSGKAAFDEIAASKMNDDIKFKARELVDTMDRQDENANLRKRKEAQSFLYNFVDSRQTSDQPFATIAQFKDTPQYKEYKDVLTPSEIKALEQRVQAPPVSDPKALESVQDLYFDTKFKGMSDSEFNASLKDLSKTDRDKYISLRNQLKKPTAGITEAQANARATSIQGFLMDDAVLAGVLSDKDPKKYSKKDKEYFSSTFTPAWEQYYTEHSSEYNLGDQAQQRALVRDFTRSFTANSANNPPGNSFFGFSYGGRKPMELPARIINTPNSPMLNTENAAPLGVKNPPKPQGKTTKPANGEVDVMSMSDAQYNYWRNEYVKETGASEPPSDPAKFQAWINKKVKK